MQLAASGGPLAQGAGSSGPGSPGAAVPGGAAAWAPTNPQPYGTEEEAVDRESPCEAVRQGTGRR
eukprot:10191410-Alexandrium_andersonii.AAC.1